MSVLFKASVSLRKAAVLKVNAAGATEPISSFYISLRFQTTRHLIFTSTHTLYVPYHQCFLEYNNSTITDTPGESLS